MFVPLAKPVRRFMTVALAAMMLISGLIAPNSTMAQSQTIQSSLTGVTITYGPPYELQEDGRNADEVMETMMFAGSADILAMGFMSPLVDINGARDIMLEALFGEVGTAATIDRGDYTGVSYSLDMLNMDGLEMGVFTLFMNQRSHGFLEFYVFLAPPAFFGQAMQTAQNAFAIDGVQLMNGVDPTVMGNMVTANIGITGGSAVTDVTDVQEQSGNSTETTQTDTGTTGNDADARQAYLTAIVADYEAVDQSLSINAQTFRDVADEVLTPAEGRVIIDEAQTYLMGTNDRIAAIPVPEDMQSFHQDALVWSNAITNSGVTWFASMNGTAPYEDAIDAINDAVSAQQTFGTLLEAELANTASGSSDTGTTTESTTTETTGSSQTGTSMSGDATEYVDAIQSQRLEFFASFGTFNEHVATLGDNATDAQIQEIRRLTTAEAEYWITFPSMIPQGPPPAGYEGVQDQYVLWADSVAELGNLWIAYMNGDRAALDSFSAQIVVVQEADNTLQEAITEANRSAGSGSTDTGSTTSTAESSTGSTRTTRTTGTTETGDAGNTSETTETGDSGNTSETNDRSSRTTTTGTSGDTSEGSETGSRSTRSTRGSDTSATTETTTSDQPNEWFMDITGATITWSDDFALNANSEDPQVNDVERGEDRISLQADTPEGVTVGLSVTVYANPGTDSMEVADALVDDPDFVAEVYGEGAEVLAYEIAPEQSAVLVLTEDEVGPYYVYVQITCVTQSCDTLALLVIPVEGYPLADTLEMMEEGVAINGISISSAIPASDVEDIVDEFGN